MCLELGVRASELPGLQAQYLHIRRIQKCQLMPHGCHQGIDMLCARVFGTSLVHSRCRCVCVACIQQTFIMFYYTV